PCSLPAASQRANLPPFSRIHQRRPLFDGNGKEDLSSMMPFALVLETVQSPFDSTNKARCRSPSFGSDQRISLRQAAVLRDAAGRDQLPTLRPHSQLGFGF